MKHPNNKITRSYTPRIVVEPSSVARLELNNGAVIIEAYGQKIAIPAMNEVGFDTLIAIRDFINDITQEASNGPTSCS